MKRNISTALKNWKNSHDRKPLILQGARQVGKTYIVKDFGEKHFKNYVYINFEADIKVHKIFENDLKPARIIKSIELHANVDIIANDTLIFFDEIQACPNALNSLKYFCEESPEYYVVAAGSLLGIKLGNIKSFPVGKVNFLELYPMTFFEFLEAIGETRLVSYIETVKRIEPIDSVAHETLCEFLKSYLIVGGMPETVKTYAESRDLLKIRNIHNEILKSYLLDFSKHAYPNQIMKITEIWSSLPIELAKENKKFVFSLMKKGARLREYETALQWLIDAGLIYISYNVKTPKLPLKAYLDGNSFKIYCLDVGLLGAMSNLSPRVLIDGDDLFTEFKGALTENLVAQTLKSNGITNLFYWTSRNTAEIDFLLNFENIIEPLEVKAGVSNHKKSLISYNQTYGPQNLHRTSLMNLKKDGKLINYPLYLLEKLTFLNQK